jgi:hypothetical protein
MTPGTTEPGYTRFVSLLWRRSISAAVVAVLAVLPLSAAVCASLCAHHGHAEAATPHGHHAAVHEHHSSSPADQTPVDTLAAFVGAVAHDCSRHGGPAGDTSAALTAARAGNDLSLGDYDGVTQPVVRPISGLSPLRPHPGSGPPPGPVSPTRAPLVLRI